MFSKNRMIILPLVIALFTGERIIQNETFDRAEDKWNGHVNFIEIHTGSEGMQSEWRMEATVVNGIATGTHSSKWSSNHGSGWCTKTETSIAEIGIDEETGTYGITIWMPGCYGKQTIDGITKDYATTDETGIVINDQRLGANHNVLSGRLVDRVTFDHGSSTTTYEWNLTRGPLVTELLVKPFHDTASYDNWLPEPGADESTPGTELKIALKLQNPGGTKPSIKAKFFELRLNNTSKEPGITINAPLNQPSSKPDLRFLQQEDATLGQDGQSIKIPSEDGETGQAVIGSYDGGGWTMLTAEAVLENNTRVTGVLEQDRSKKEIPIPKRDAGKQIASYWLARNGNPAETDDNETTAGNPNNGDGLSAYEEYRGVISEGKFRRLDPKKKDLGVKMKKSEKSLFADGIKKFESASNLSVIPFDENEIAADRRLNKNSSHAHVYSQFVLFLQKGTLASNKNGEAFGGPATPKQVSQIQIDFNNVHDAYQNDQSEAVTMNTTLPYSEPDLLATVIAHELAHGVNVSHHGSREATRIDLTITPDRTAVRIFDHRPAEVFTRPYLVNGRAGDAGNEQSGDLTCIMVPNALCHWVVRESPDSLFFYEVPVIPLGNRLCDSKAGTGINSNNRYFGDATIGKCREQLKLK